MAKYSCEHHHFIGPDFHQVFVAERANRSIHQLKCALRDVDVTVEEGALDPSASINVENEDTEMAWHELQHSHAGECDCQSEHEWHTGDSPNAAEMTAFSWPLYCQVSVAV